MMLCLPVTAEAEVPSPTITAPTPAIVTPGDPPRDYPFLETDVDLASYGYVEQENVMEGTASQYTTPVGATGTAINTGYPNKTRLVVRRPISASALNGTVILQWYNFTNGFDVEPVWFQTHNYVLKHRCARIGVSSQRVGANYLPAWSPAGRYASLDVSNSNLQGTSLRGANLNGANLAGATDWRVPCRTPIWGCRPD
jgi:Alpha/beta hydrolase domain/Pentapeptide repeats (8 copies)